MYGGVVLATPDVWAELPEGGASSKKAPTRERESVYSYSNKRNDPCSAQCV